MSALECGGQTLWQLVGPCRQRDQHARGGWALEQGTEQIGRGRVGPVKVVKEQHQRLSDRQTLKECSCGAVRSVALV